MVLEDVLAWEAGTPLLTVDVPALTTSLRGGVAVTVEVRTLDHGVHSGMYGGAVPDALTALCRLLATLHDADGNVAVAGLQAGDAGGPDLNEEQLRADAGLREGVRFIGSGSLTSRLWTRPSLTVVGIDAPSVEAAANTLLPVARAKISMRVAPGDDSATAGAALRQHLQTHAPWGAQVTVTGGGIAEPFTSRAGGPAATAARESFASAWRTAPVDIGVGGSIPFIGACAATFPDAEVLITGVEDPDTRAHGANESLHLAMFEKACVAEALLLDRLSRRSAAGDQR